MKVHTTDHANIFIEIADDCPVSAGQTPPMKGMEPTIATMQYDLIAGHPYKYTSDDVVFHCYAQKNGLSKGDLPAAREAFFSKGQPCLRASPLTKRYGFGVHSNAECKVALYGAETEEYAQMVKDDGLIKVKAMRSKRA
jgi:hypothetical protein